MKMNNIYGGNIANIISAFDIETSVLPGEQQSFMYLWSWQVGDKFYQGRTWDEFMTKAKELAARDDTLVVYVYNLSYEFEFLSGIYDFQPEEVFALDAHKILKCTMLDGHLEFRCAYLLCDMSLDEFTRKMGVEHPKLEMDYNIVRYPWTTLTKEELEYARNDVLGLCEAISEKMRKDGDTLSTISLTATGYVRRDVKKAMRGHFKDKWKIDYDTYTLLREAFRGGNAHSAPCFRNYILPDVKSVDISSSYLACQCNEYFPIGEWLECDAAAAIEKGYAVVFRVAFDDIYLKDGTWGCPYIALSKCREVKGANCDEGRVTSARHIEMTITDVDWSIICDEYECKSYSFGEAYCSEYGKLPSALTDVSRLYYENKTQLKNIEGKEYEYDNFKRKANSIFGMAAQDIGRADVVYKNGEYVLDDNYDQEKKVIESNKKAFQSYAWGVWMTAWARYRLEEGIKFAGDKFVYCDTDSVKYIGDLDWDTFNIVRKNAALENNACAMDSKGNIHYMGMFEIDGDYSRFITLGVKRYAYEDAKDGTLHITVAGIQKEAGVNELESLDNFKAGYLFKNLGNANLYNKVDKFVEIDGHKLRITNNVYIGHCDHLLRSSAYKSFEEYDDGGVGVSSLYGHKYFSKL